MSKKNKEIDKRVYRHKRRIRSLILSYLVLIVIIGAIGAGGFFGFKAVKGAIDNKKASIAAAEAELQAAAEAEKIAELEAAAAAEAEPEEVEEEVEEYTEEDLLDEVVQACISEMPLEDKVAGLFIVTPEQLTNTDKVIKAGDGTKAALEQYPVGGLIYFKQNIKSEDQLTEMLANTISYSKYPIFLAVDEELGSVSRVRSTLKLEETKTPKELGEAGDTNLAYESSKQIGEYLTTYGFNLDFAPVADLSIEGIDSAAIGDRSFGTDVALTSNLVAASVEGLEESGVTSCLKHFPGHGSVKEDTHEGMASSERTAEEFKANELEVFKAGIDAGSQMVMIGHFAAPSLTGDDTLPCSLSKEVMTDLLRGEYQYDGVIITDALNMTAISEYYGADEACIKALKAGADMLLMPEDFETAYNGVLEAVKDGTISEQRINDSLARVYRIKYKSTIE